MIFLQILEYRPRVMGDPFIKEERLHPVRKIQKIADLRVRAEGQDPAVSFES